MRRTREHFLLKKIQILLSGIDQDFVIKNTDPWKKSHYDMMHQSPFRHVYLYKLELGKTDSD